MHVVFKKSKNLKINKDVLFFKKCSFKNLKITLLLSRLPARVAEFRLSIPVRNVRGNIQCP